MSMFLYTLVLRLFPNPNVFVQTCIMMLFFCQRHMSKLTKDYLRGGMEVRLNYCKN